MDPQEHSEEAIFLACIELPPEERAAFLESVCSGDKQKRNSVESLIRAHETEDAFLDSIPDGPILEESVRASRTARRDEKAGDSVGHYELIEILGEGAWGKVWKARQTEPIEREVALKILKVGLDTEEFLRRFHDEQRVLAKLNYPNIATILDAGATKRGRPYLVMELVRGKPLIEYANEKRLSIERRIQTFIWVCKAVQYAHSKGVVHRDIKPSNVLVKEVQSEAIPKVIDFGIAKTVQAPVAERADGEPAQSFMGTPYYSSPEQLEGRYEDVDARSDIYSLGALLYELITGRRYLEIDDVPDLKGEAIRKLLADAMPTEPSSAYSKLSLEERETIAAGMSTARRELERRIKGELDWVVMKCLQRDPVRRYQSALELADDLQAYLKDRPVLASAPGLVYRSRKFFKRHKFGSTVAVVASVTLLATVLISVAINGDRDTTSSRDPDSKYEPVVPEYRQISFTGYARKGIFSPDGQYLAYASHGSNVIIVRDLKRGENLQIPLAEVIDDLPEFPMVRVVGWSPDSKELVASYSAGEASATVLIPLDGGKARVLATGSLDWTIWPEGSDHILGLYSNLSLAPLVNIPLEESTDQLVRWNYNLLENFSMFKGHRLKEAVWLPLEQRIFLVSVELGKDRSHFWTMDREGMDIRYLLEVPFEIISAARSPDGTSAYVTHSSDQQNAITKISLMDKNKRTTLLLGNYESLSLSKEGLMLVTRVQQSSNLALAETDSAGSWIEKPLTFGTWTHRNPSLSPDGQKIAFNRGDNNFSNIFVMSQDSRVAKQLTFFEASQSNFPAWSPDGETIAFGSNEGGQRRIWLMNHDGSDLRPVDCPDLSPSLFVTWTPDSRLLYQVMGDRIHRILDISSGQVQPMIEKEGYFYGDQVLDLNDPRVGYTFAPRMSPDLSKIAVLWNRLRGEGLWIVNKTNPVLPSYQIAGAAQKTRGVIFQNFDATSYKGKRVRLTFRAKTNPIWESPGARHFRVRLIVLKSLPDPLLLESDFLRAGGRAAMSTDWKDYEIEYTLPEETNFISIEADVFGVGEAELDDLSLNYKSEAGVWAPIEIENPSFELGATGVLPVGWKAARPHGNFVFETALDSESASNKVLKTSSSPLPNSGFGYYPLRWSESGEALYCRYRGALLRYSMSEGAMTEVWRSSTENNYRVDDVTPDGNRLVYTVSDYKSDLWTIENFDPEFSDASSEIKGDSSVLIGDPIYEFSDPYADLRASVAILPLETRSNQGNHVQWVSRLDDALSDKMDLNPKLDTPDAVVPNLNVDSIDDIRAMADKLGVRILLRGDVEGFADSILINMRLIEAGTGTVVWSDSFARDWNGDLQSELQEDLSTAIADTVEHVAIEHEIEKARKASTQSFAAMENYFKGRESAKLDSASELAQAVTYFERAIGHDDSFALAYAALGEVLLKQVVVSGLSDTEQFEKAESVILKALELDETIGEARAALNLLRFRRMISEMESVRILGTLPIPIPEDGARGYTGGLFHAYPFVMPEGQDYLLANLEVACLGSEVPNFAIWTCNGVQPGVELVSFYSRNEERYTNLKFHPDAPITLRAGESYALVYKGKGVIQTFIDSLKTPTGVAHILIDESEMVRKHSKYNQWVVKGLEKGRRTGRLLEGGEIVVDKGYFSRAFGGFGFEIRGVPLP